MRTLTKVGNSYAALIPRQIMAILGIDPKTKFSFETDGKNLIFKPQETTKQNRRDKLVAAAKAHSFKKYHKTLIALADK